MEHEFPSEKFPTEKPNCISDFALLSKIFHWNDTKSRVQFNFQPEFPES